MHPNIAAELVLRHLAEQAARDRRIPLPRRADGRRRNVSRWQSLPPVR